MAPYPGPGNVAASTPATTTASALAISSQFNVRSAGPPPAFFKIIRHPSRPGLRRSSLWENWATLFRVGFFKNFNFSSPASEWRSALLWGSCSSLPCQSKHKCASPSSEKASGTEWPSKTTTLAHHERACPHALWFWFKEPASHAAVPSCHPCLSCSITT